MNDPTTAVLTAEQKRLVALGMFCGSEPAGISEFKDAHGGHATLVRVRVGDVSHRVLFVNTLPACEITSPARKHFANLLSRGISVERALRIIRSSRPGPMQAAGPGHPTKQPSVRRRFGTQRG